MDEDDFLDAIEDDNKAGGEVTTEVIETPVVFEEPTPAPIVEPIIAEPEKPEAGFIPIAALMDERDKAKAARAELEALKAQLAQQPAPTPPDMFEDPEAYDAFNNQKLLNMKLDIAEDVSRDKHGDELVDQAKDWVLQQFAARPAFRDEVLSQRNPYNYAVTAFQKAQIADNVTPTDFAEFQAWKAAQSAVPPPPQTTSIPPRSLASAPSAGGIAMQVEQDDAEIFDDIFVRK